MKRIIVVVALVLAASVPSYAVTVGAGADHSPPARGGHAVTVPWEIGGPAESPPKSACSSPQEPAYGESISLDTQEAPPLPEQGQGFYASDIQAIGRPVVSLGGRG